MPGFQVSPTSVAPLRHVLGLAAPLLSDCPAISCRRWGRTRKGVPSESDSAELRRTRVTPLARDLATFMLLPRPSQPFVVNAAGRGWRAPFAHAAPGRLPSNHSVITQLSSTVGLLRRLSL